MSKDNGGPAFPDTFPHNSSGMTLRDYFAAKAMQGIITVNKFRIGSDEPPISSQVATAAYRIAEAMLKEREK